MNYADPSGRFIISSVFLAAAIGGAVAGALIGTASHVIVSGQTGTDVTTQSVLTSFTVGALTGAVGAIGGAFGGTAAVICSISVGLLSGSVVAFSTEGSIVRKLTTGLAAGLVAGFGAYLGAQVPVALDSAFALGITAYTGGLFIGAQAEVISVAAQMLAGYIYDWLENYSLCG